MLMHTVAVANHKAMLTAGGSFGELHQREDSVVASSRQRPIQAPAVGARDSAMPGEQRRPA
jgi:hypothetical protein